MELWLVAAALVLMVALLTLLSSRRKPPPPPPKYLVGDITLESLRGYCGYDIMRPVLLAIKGKVYDVTNSFDVYGPGRERHVFAGREVSRALAKGSVLDDDCTDNLDGLTADELQALELQAAEFEAKYDLVGQVVAPRELTLAELTQHDGSDPTKPLYLAIKGKVYDITRGKQFYGPDGIYPFAGKEVARAFALISTDVADCNDNLEGLSPLELENLRDWIGKFDYKYPVIGRLVPEAKGAQ